LHYVSFEQECRVIEKLDRRLSVGADDRAIDVKLFARA